MPQCTKTKERPVVVRWWWEPAGPVWCPSKVDPQIIDPAHLLVDPGISWISSHPVLVPTLGRSCPPSSQWLVPARVRPSVVPPQPRCCSLPRDQNGSPLHLRLSLLLIALSPVTVLFITTDEKAWDGRHSPFNNVHKNQKYHICITNLRSMHIEMATFPQMHHEPHTLKADP